MGMKKEFRKIIHVDMDAFFASVEQRDNPELRGKPIVVGGAERRGVVAAASYEARKFGVHSAMPGFIAKQKCPELIFVRGSFDKYVSISRQIMEIFRSYTDLVEPMSLDEAYMDVTTNKKNIRSATLIAKEIRKRIQQDTGLTASAGISFNKFLAKVASDFNKPDGMTLITPDIADEFVEELPVRKIPGVGKVTEAKMKNLNIHTGLDIKNLSMEKLTEYFGKTGSYFYRIVRHEYDSQVSPERIRKSIGAERTLMSDIAGLDEMEEALERIVNRLAQRMLKYNMRGKTITLKIKYHDFRQTTRSKTLNFFVNPETGLMGILKELLRTPVEPTSPVRLLGVSISSLNIKEEDNLGQLTLDF